jgi:8-amino-7-oxononanoate synthase
MDRVAWIEGALAALEGAGLRRRLTTRQGPQAARLVLDGRPLVNFGSNDYLGLAGDPRLAAAAAAALREEGTGSGASPLVTGHTAAHHRLETRLAEFEGVQAAVLFPSGFAANTGTIAALVGPGDVVFCDAANHASLWDGCRLSRADVRAYPHADCRALDCLLAAAGGAPGAARVPGAAGWRRKLVATDGLFSMDGDLAPLGELAEVCESHAAMLLVDEAHATGVLGPRGRGAAELAGIEHRTSVRIGTLSKALGAAGGFAAGSRLLVEWLVNRARPYIYSTALPPAMAAAALAALEIVAAEPQRRRELQERAGALRRALSEKGWNLGRSSAQILPVLVGEPARALELSARLAERGLFVPAIRPPTVPAGQACLRISLTAGHSQEMIERLIAAMGEAGSSR